MSKHLAFDNSLASIEECLEALEHRDRYLKSSDEFVCFSSQTTSYSPKYSQSTTGSERFCRSRHDRELITIKHDIDTLKSTFIEKTEHILHLEALFQRTLNQISLEIEQIQEKRKKVSQLESKLAEKLSNHLSPVPVGVFPAPHKNQSKSPNDFSFSHNEGEETSNFSFGQIDENIEVNLPHENECREFEEFLKTQQSTSFHSDRVLEEHEVMQIPYLFDLNLKTSSGSKVLAPGSSLTEKYKVEKMIASTHFSTVLQCFDLFERKKVCIKVIHNQKETFDQGLDEVKIMSLLQKSCKGDLPSKHIVRILEFFYYKESLHIVYELLGENLFVLVSNPHISHIFQGEVLNKIIKQLLTALSFIHSQGIIHADIKPENILLSSPLTPRRSFNSFDVRLVDFGSSCYQTDTLTTYIQSKAYRAPEVIIGGAYNTKIDIWSLGCVIAELLTKEVLFEANSIKEMITKVRLN